MKMKTKLGYKERMVIKGLLPQKADICNQIIAKDIMEKVTITQKEQESVEMKTVGNSLQWDNDKEIAKEIDFTNPEVELLKAQIKQRDKAKEITIDTLDTIIKVRDLKGT